jgi:hypothetical protein
MTEPTTETTTPTPDGYTGKDAARLLGVTPRRVRQLLDAGTLASAWPGERPEGAPIILDRESVHKEREARKTSRKETGKPEGNTGGGVEVADLLDVFERMQERTLETLRAERAEVLAIRDRTEEDLRNALAAERAAREMAEREAARVSGEVEELRAEAERLRVELTEQRTVQPGIYWGAHTLGPEDGKVDSDPAPPAKRRRWWQG